jgi:hypothetical protein
METTTVPEADGLRGLFDRTEPGWGVGEAASYLETVIETGAGAQACVRSVYVLVRGLLTHGTVPDADFESAFAGVGRWDERESVASGLEALERVAKRLRAGAANVSELVGGSIPRMQNAGQLLTLGAMLLAATRLAARRHLRDLRGKQVGAEAAQTAAVGGPT